MDDCAICGEEIEEDYLECDGCTKKYHIRCDGVAKKDILARKNSNRLKIFCEKCNNAPKIIMKDNIKTIMQFIYKIDVATQLHEKSQSEMGYEMEIMKEKLEMMTKSINEIKNTGSNNTKSYAATLKNNMKVPIVVKPKEKNQDSNATKEFIKTKIDFKNVKADGLRKIRDGGIIIDCDSNADSIKISEMVRSKVGNNYSVEMLEIKKPRLKIINLHDDMSETEIIDNLKIQNDLPNTAQIKLIKNIKRTNNRNPNNINYDIVIETDHTTYDKLVNKQAVNIGWSKCKIFRHTHLLRCYNCCGFSHIAKDCKNKKACSQCGGEHNRSECESEDLKCTNCTIMCDKFKLKLNTKHNAFDRKCEIYSKKISQLQNKFGYMSANK